MKKRVLISLLVIVGLFTITACGEKKENNNNEEKNDKNEVVDKDYSGTFKDDDSSEIIIEKVDNTYKVDIALYRLASFSNVNVDEIKDDVLYLSGMDPSGEKIKFTFNYDTKVLTVTESSWELLNQGATYTFDK